MNDSITLANSSLTVLWTDWLVFLLFFISVVAIIRARQREDLMSAWRQIANRRMAMASLVVLLSYAFVGLLDSVHFKVQETGELISLFDVAADTLKSQEEKTYSSPFATRLYMKETIEFPDGSSRRDFPRLEFGGAHLEDPQQRSADIIKRFVTAVIEALALWLICVLLVSAIVAKGAGIKLAEAIQRIRRGRTVVAWDAVLMATAGIMLLLLLIVNFGGAYHILGTDKVGQDVLYLSLKSIRTGLVIGALTTLVMLPFAIALGIAAGYFRGWVDDVVQYTYTTLSSIPGVLLIAAAVLMMQAYIAANPEQFSTISERADARLLFLCLILGVTSWTGLCRLLRGETLKLRELDYLQAAVAFGVANSKIVWRHLLPNVMHIVLISIVLDFSGLVLAEAVLSYVGVGVDPSMISWGNMINSARLEMAREPLVWWSLLAAFIFMFLLVLAANLFADAVRDAFDPRLRRQ